MSLLVRNVEVDGALVDVEVIDGIVTQVAPRPLTRHGDVLDGTGGALIPGLHDHHLHLYATAAGTASTAVGPPHVRNADGLRLVLAEADRSLPPGGWLRAIGYHETVAGDLDRSTLDRLVPLRPTRVQDRTGARWTLNSAALDALRIDERSEEGIERDAAGRPTGRLHRADAWLRDLLPPTAAPDLAALGAQLARCGVTGVTDTTPFEWVDDLAALAAAVAGGSLPQRVVVTGGPALADAVAPAVLERGPVKIVIDDGAYPSLNVLAAQIASAHGHRRAVAIHCVTRTALVLAVAAWDVAGAAPGDRVEHGAVIPVELIADLRRHDLTVVTQPGFVAERGDEYLAEVDPDDIPHLYRCASLLDAGVRVAGSTDAPYSAPDPWRAMRAAVARTTRSGALLGGGEAVSPRRALRLFLGDPHDPGGAPRMIAPGAPGDLCLLAHPLDAVLGRLTADDVVATIRAGEVIHDRRTAGASRVSRR